ncbi:PREDICTED: uncharacterized protein LOC109125001 [Camelina sativa]|uniref:Uncharacterized protein LOC109125001 n=1 Tax=Camelina sativa TaxID=90675 RepID=A0ABM1QKQ7_CAMSA|nr:PREDICTED: uncharacterized protein LOC109125001 [Camelina sativa]
MEVQYPDWLSNPVVVKKKNGKWRVCVDFTDLNKACPKDSFPLPHIARLVEATTGNQLLSFMDAFSGYNPIAMSSTDRKKTVFITDRGTYCYKVMPFGLKNAGATYQRLVNMMFVDLLRRTMEVYIDDMLCTFGITSGEFLGYIVTERGIEANSKQIEAILGLPSPTNKREVERLTGRIATLNHFIARSTNKCLPFYHLLRGNKDFHWDDTCEIAFRQLKTSQPVLVKPENGETLYLYVLISGSTVRGVLVRNDRGDQRPIFYTSKALNNAESRYPTLEKLASNNELGDPTPREEHWTMFVDGSSSHQGSGVGLILRSPSGEVLKQALKLNSKASNNETEYEAILAGLRLARGLRVTHLQVFCDSQLVVSQFSGEFYAKSERMGAYRQLVRTLSEEFNSFSLTKVPRSGNTSADALASLANRSDPDLQRTIPVECVEAPNIDLANLVTFINDDSVPMEVEEPIEDLTDVTKPPDDWQIEIKLYISEWIVPPERWAARRLKAQSARYVLFNGNLYRLSSSGVFLTCVSREEVELIMTEVHEGEGGNHSGGRALSLKIKKDSHYWPTMVADCEAFSAKCEACQRHGPMRHVPPELLSTVTAPYPFMRWAMDQVRPLLPSRSKKFILVLTDYFIKWVEAESFTKVQSLDVTNFICKNIICRHGLPYEIVTDNGTQFTSLITRRFLSKWQIRLGTSTPRYPQGNGQAKAMNKSIVDGLKKRLFWRK